jgi:crossover junction endodeoxyribonuclease RuvC
MGMGVDFGVRRVALSVADPDLMEEMILRPRTHPVGEANDPVALEDLARYTYEYVSSYGPDLVVIESPIQGVSVNVKVGLRLAQVAGVLVVACRQAGSSTVLVGPTEWKKAITGHGNANKGQIAEWLQANRPDLAEACGASQDLVDATCMALFAEGRLEGRL